MSSLKSLVLDECARPVQVITWEKAIVLLSTGRAVCILNLTNHPIRTVSSETPRPSIIQMVRGGPWMQKRVSLVRQNIYLRDGYRCAYCGDHGRHTQLTLDHVFPVSRGGGRTWQNLVTACLECNQRKADRTPEECGMRLASAPREPAWGLLYVFGGLLGQEGRDWLAFLDSGKADLSLSMAKAEP